MILKAWGLAALCLLGCARDAAAATHATFLSPVDGAQLSASPSLQWTAVAGAQAYVLWVGSTPGGSDLLASGEITALSHAPVNVPENVPVFARIWTKLGGAWRYADARFAVAASPAAALYNGATGDFSVQLDVGRDVSTGGAGWRPDERVLLADLNGDALADVFRYDPATGDWERRVNLGDGRFRLSSGQWPGGGAPHAADLDGDGRADVFLYNPEAGLWQACYSDPGDGFTCASGLWAPHWTLHVGDFNGDAREDLFLYNGEDAAADPNSGRWFKVLSMARGSFHYVDGSPRWAPYWQIVPADFNGDRRTDLFLYHRDSGRWFVGLEAGAGFTYLEGAWEPGWDLYPGDYDGNGRADLFLYRPDTGHWRQALTEVPGTFRSSTGLWGRGWTVTPGALNADGRTDLLLYDSASGRWARVLAAAPGAFDYSYGTWAPGYTTVLAGGKVPLSRPVAVPSNPASGSGDTSRAFEWTAPPMARAYRLQIGTSVGAGNLHDSGRIDATRRFVRGLPQGVRLYGRLSTETSAGWQPFDFTFVVRPGTPAADVGTQIDASMALTAEVRAMASATNAPFGWTPLFAYATGHGDWGASCSDYAVVLARLLAQLNVTLSSRVFHVAFNLNAYDMHTLVEMRDPRVEQWLLLDPTFAMTVRRTGDGGYATARNVSDAARALRWSDLEFVPLGPDGLRHAEDYYIDYPLLYLNVISGSGATSGAVSVLPYVAPVALPDGAGGLGLYLLQSPVSPRTVVIDGTSRSMTFGGVDRVTYIFLARAIAPPAAGQPALGAYVPRRFVF